MSYFPLVIESLLVCWFVIFLIRRYGDWENQNKIVLISAFISWYTSMLIVVLLPIDVSSTCYRQCLKDHSATTNSTKILEESCGKPWSNVSPLVLPNIWRIVYWSSQILTWFLLPFMQSYVLAGDFTVSGRLRTALVENSIYYGLYLLLFGICLIYVALRPDIHISGAQLKVIGITASNTFGLFLLMLILGYGLVEVPRDSWYYSQPDVHFKIYCFRLAKLSVEKTEADEFLEDIFEDIRRIANSVGKSHPFRPYVETLVNKCPEGIREDLRLNHLGEYDDFEEVARLHIKKLVQLHRRLIRTLQTCQRTHVQWERTILHAIAMEEVMMNIENGETEFSEDINRPWPFSSFCNPTLEWYWNCRLRHWLLKLLCVVLTLVGLIIVWSECSFFVESPVLSVFALLLRESKKHNHYFWMEMASLATITYLVFCVFYTVFKIRFFNYYYLAPEHQTSENSLMFCGVILCRLTPPLCLNYLGMMHLDSHVTEGTNLEEASYTAIMGHMDVIGFISDGFNIYFPILIVIVCIIAFFKVIPKTLNFFGIQQFLLDDNLSSDLSREGLELLVREKRKRTRMTEVMEERKSYLSQRSISAEVLLGTAQSGSKVQSADNRTSKASQAGLPSRGSSTTRVGMENRDSRSNRLSLFKKLGRVKERGEDEVELMSATDPVDYVAENYQSMSDPCFESNLDARASHSRNSRTSSSSLNKRQPPSGLFDDV